ncbi:MAG: ATP-binding protein [Lachnospiraceae bacterium]|nr:ATP-binding protein [Lachnospiraceae bacterium]
MEQRAYTASLRLFSYFGSKADKYKTGMFGGRKGSALFAAEDTDAEDARVKVIEGVLSDEALIFALHLSVAAFLYPQVKRALKELTGGGPNLMLALEVCGELGRWSFPALREGYDVLCRYLAIADSRQNILYRELAADGRLVSYLAGDDELPAELGGAAALWLLAPEDRERYYGFSKTAALVEKEYMAARSCSDFYVLQLAGKEGIGRKSAVALAAEAMDRAALVIYWDRLAANDKKKLGHFLWLLRREAYFYGCAVIFDRITVSEKPDVDELFYRAIRHFKNHSEPVVVCTDLRTELMPEAAVPIRRIEVPFPDKDSRIEAWKGISAKYGMELDAEGFGGLSELPYGDINRVLLSLSSVWDNGWSEEKKAEHIINACMECYPAPKKGSLKHVDVSVTIEDLKLSDRQKRPILELIDGVRNSHLVYDVWGMKEKLPYGRNFTALFVGPPGTGKTMAANALSTALRIPLYRIDLSQVVDKYIGETEKRLEEIFAYAQNTNVILFFDEADAIFGKRTEVSEAKDKYANTEMSFILQRIEEYNGIVILTSNMKKNIDTAFMRRMKYVVHFEMPDEETRCEILKSCFAPDVPQKDIDFQFLAEKVELAGGYLKNIVLNAVFLAAARNSPVTMEDMVKSVIVEYGKIGQVASFLDLGKYSHLLH